MSASLKHCARWGLCMVLGLAATDAAAQGLFDFNTMRYSTRDQFYFWMSLSRATAIAVSTAAGFALGWFCSPQAKALRHVLLIVVALAAIGIAIFNQSMLGWSVATILAVIGFCCGLGYWLSRAISRLLELPTTFGSAKWADIDHIKARLQTHNQ